MQREFTVIVERDLDGWLVGSIPELKGCHTQARSMDELLERIKEAAELCLEENGFSEGLDLIGIQRIGIEV